MDQVIWTYVTGIVPLDDLVHINRYRSDDRFNNLLLKSDVRFMKENKISYSDLSQTFAFSNDVEARRFRSFDEAKVALFARDSTILANSHHALEN